MVMTIHFQSISISVFPTFAQLKLEWNSKQIICGTTVDGVMIIDILFLTLRLRHYGHLYEEK